MIHIIREQLGLTREDLAGFLGLSTDMIKSVERGRRQLSTDSIVVVAALYQTMKDAQAGGPVGDPAPVSSTQVKHMKRLHRKCSRRLKRSAAKLEKMQKAYASACIHLRVYQLLAESQAGTNGDHARLKWTEWKIAEVTRCIQENNQIEQELLVVEIAGLKGIIQAMAESQFFRPVVEI